MAPPNAALAAAPIVVPDAADAVRPVLHSHHYHHALQRALLRMEGIGAPEILARAAAEVVYVRLTERLHTLPEGADDAERLAAAAALHADCGFGTLDLSGVERDGGSVHAPGAHLLAPDQPRPGPAPEAPACAFTAGFVQGALAAVFGGWYTVGETRCAAGGSRGCRFQAKPADAPQDWPPEPIASVPWAGAPEPADPLEARVARMLLNPAPAPDAHGYLRLWDSLFTRVWADYYTRVCYRFEQELPRIKGNKYTHTASVMLTETGHLCAHHTLGGLLRSRQWADAMMPYLSNAEDRLRAAVAVVNVLGWGRWSIAALEPGERLIVRVEGSYEAAGYRALFGEAPRPKCYLAQGLAAGLMNLVYSRPLAAVDTKDPSGYDTVFRSPTSFRAMEITCAAEGAPACQVVVTRLSSVMG